MEFTDGKEGTSDGESVADSSGAFPEATKTETETLRCNGSDRLCDRKFNDVAYATTHNAMSNAQDGWFPPNQSVPIVYQLRDGIRGLMLDTYLHENEPYLCHANCDVGKKKMVEALTEIRVFLEQNPHEVVTLILESYLSAEQTQKAFQSSGLLAMTHTQSQGQDWPTLRTMIERNQRVVVLTDQGGGTYPWYHDMWKMAWDTRWKNSSVQDFSCKPDRGNTKNPLWILNHFLGNPLPSPKLAKEANSNPFFVQRVLQCKKEAGQLPNFITIDFHQEGDILAVVRTLNGLD